MIERIIYKNIKEALAIFPAIAILGPRQVGKTTLALDLAKDCTPKPIYIDLEKPSDKLKLSDPEYYLSQYFNQLVIIDEVQRAPELFTILRSMIDERKRQGLLSGHYLLLGSASKLLLQQSSESLAGRIIYTELYGFNIIEIGTQNIEKLWIRGGFPDSFLAKNDQISFFWREAFITTYIEREIPIMGHRISPDTLKRFWTMLAYNQGELLNASKLASNLGVSCPTIPRYLDILTDLFMIRILRPWHSNIGKRLVKAPKIYIRDSGLAHCLLNIHSLDQLLSHPVLGNSWEGFIIENIASIVGNSVKMYFYRTAAGAEIDLLLESKAGSLIAIEIKRGLAPSITKSLHEAIATLNPMRTFIIYPGNEHYKLTDKVEVISLTKFLDIVMSLI